MGGCSLICNDCERNSVRQVLSRLPIHGPGPASSGARSVSHRGWHESLCRALMEQNKRLKRLSLCRKLFGFLSLVSRNNERRSVLLSPASLCFPLAPQTSENVHRVRRTPPPSPRSGFSPL